MSIVWDVELTDSDREASRLGGLMGRESLLHSVSRFLEWVLALIELVSLFEISLHQKVEPDGVLSSQSFFL